MGKSGSTAPPRMAGQYFCVRPRPRMTALRMMWAGVFTEPIVRDRGFNEADSLDSAAPPNRHYDRLEGGTDSGQRMGNSE